VGSIADIARERFFDLHKLKETHTEITEKPFIAKYLLEHYAKIKNLSKDLPRVPANNEYFFLQSDTQFNAFTFIPFVAQIESIEYLHATTYTINKQVVDALVQMHDKGQIEQIELLVSDSLKTRNPSVIEYINAQLATRPNFKVNYSWVHAKVTLLKTNTAYYVIEGSGNWAANAQYEQYLFTHSKGLYDFRMKLFTEINLK